MFTFAEIDYFVDEGAFLSLGFRRDDIYVEINIHKSLQEIDSLIDFLENVTNNISTSLINGNYKLIYADNKISLHSEEILINALINEDSKVMIENAYKCFSSCKEQTWIVLNQN